MTYKDMWKLCVVKITKLNYVSTIYRKNIRSISTEWQQSLATKFYVYQIISNVMFIKKLWSALVIFYYT